MAISASFEEKVYLLAYTAYGKDLTDMQGDFLTSYGQNDLHKVAQFLLDSGYLGTDYSGTTDRQFVSSLTESYANGLVSAERQQVTKQYFTNELQQDGVDKADIMVNMLEAMLRSTDSEWSTAASNAYTEVLSNMNDFSSFAFEATPSDELTGVDAFDFTDHHDDAVVYSQAPVDSHDITLVGTADVPALETDSVLI
ncbi:hypothetical protein BFW38_03680 [Terasakiispira papahanaumokuakeensis]|uniref:Uncharacterized protein n=1 Tax=Terasakiispira papahanaumokuakeensis TaxID=197479 RepID=A0A1E2V714_9GAMM|nr:hypothetical protein [Terasakiispira papahanaumokuakeensis]ODC02777.1 hypothetical protein BFW38_03680 [Terasakiispira papahanaumokuakeensis]